MKTTLLVLSFFSFFHAGYCQPKPVVSEIGEWKLTDDHNSRWEFKIDGKLLLQYEGRDIDFSFSYNVSASKPVCPGMEIGEQTNVTYLKRVNDLDGDIRCYYIMGLTEERLTLIDASNGRLSTFIRVE